MQGTHSSMSVHLVRQGNKINKTKGTSSLGILATEWFCVTIWFVFSFVVFYFYFLICSYKYNIYFIIIKLVRKNWTTPERMHCCCTSYYATTILFQNPEWKHNIKSPLGGKDKGSISYKKQCTTSRTWGLHQMC